MFTWNFQYVSKVKLVETLNQFLLNYQRGDILIRIHTSIHLEDEAVDLAKFIKNNVPSAHIFGTSTSATVYNGKLNPNQCIISVTLMSEAKVKTAMIPAYDIKTGESVTPDVLCAQVKNATITPKTKLLLTFLNDNYKDVYEFVEKSNDYFPGVRFKQPGYGSGENEPDMVALFGNNIQAAVAAHTPHPDRAAAVPDRALQVMAWWDPGYRILERGVRPVVWVVE